MRKLPNTLLGAVTGMMLIVNPAAAEQIGIINKELVCKRPKENERQLKLHSCATFEYPLGPLVPSDGVNPSPDPVPPYSS